MFRMWAFVRRIEYLTGLVVLLGLLGWGIYYAYWYVAPTCFDLTQNGNERGKDCGGACTRICTFDVIEPVVLWSRAFRVTNGQYNAVAYLENRNLTEGMPELRYTFKLYDNEGLITEKNGVTVLPPGSTYPIFEGRINTGTRVPTRADLVFVGYEDALWLPATAGSEQFKVIKRELKNTDYKPVLTASLENTSLEEARDVEVVATIFDARKNALTTSSTFVKYFPGRAVTDVVFTWPEPISKTIRSCEVPTDVVLAIDLSGSMNDDGGVPPEPISSVLKAAEAFVNRLNQDDQIGVVTYATNATTRENLTTNKTRVAEVVRNLTILKADETGSTNTGDAILRATEELNSSRHNQNARKVLVLLSDGLANAPGETPEIYAQDSANALKAMGVEIFTIGLGDKVNDLFLSAIASNASQYLKAASSGNVDTVYRSITGAICEDGVAVIEIIPKTSASFAPLQ